MWFYDNVTREEFEKRKDYVEKVMLELGAIKFKVQLPYEQKTTHIPQMEMKIFGILKGIHMFIMTNILEWMKYCLRISLLLC